MSALEAVIQQRSIIKGRRAYMRARRWREDDWYRAWPDIADEWTMAAAVWGQG